MTFGYALLGALVLLLPGFAGYYGTLLGETGGLVGPRPDRPNSNLAIFLIVFFALIAHLVGAGMFALNDVIARIYPVFTISVDPSPYKALLIGQVPARMSNLVIEGELLYLVLLTLGTGVVFEFFAKRSPITSSTAPLRFGWLLPIVRLVEARTHVVIGYVLTTVGNDGEWIAYEGIVQRLSLDDDDAIKMIVLQQCDRFVVRIVDGKVERVDSGSSETIALLHIRSEQVANYALEVLEVLGV